MDVRLAAPKECSPEPELLERCREMAATSGAKFLITEDVGIGVKDADFLYTDVWVSMGEPESKWQERIELLKPYQVNRKAIELRWSGSHRGRVRVETFDRVRSGRESRPYDKSDHGGHYRGLTPAGWRLSEQMEVIIPHGIFSK